MESFTSRIDMLIEYVMHSSKSIIFTQCRVPRHGSTRLRHRGRHQTAWRPETQHRNNHKINTGRLSAPSFSRPIDPTHQDPLSSYNQTVWGFIFTARAGGLGTTDSKKKPHLIQWASCFLMTFISSNKDDHFFLLLNWLVLAIIWMDSCPTRLQHNTNWWSQPHWQDMKFH